VIGGEISEPTLKNKSSGPERARRRRSEKKRRNAKTTADRVVGIEEGAEKNHNKKIDIARRANPLSK